MPRKPWKGRVPLPASVRHYGEQASTPQTSRSMAPQNADFAYLFANWEEAARMAGEVVASAWQMVRSHMGYTQDLGLVHQAAQTGSARSERPPLSRRVPKPSAKLAQKVRQRAERPIADAQRAN